MIIRDSKQSTFPVLYEYLQDIKHEYIHLTTNICQKLVEMSAITSFNLVIITIWFYSSNNIDLYLYRNIKYLF